MNILKECLQDCGNSELLTKVEIDALEVKLKKRVIAMSDPNKFDLE